jgi:hypothetical protein
MYCKFHTDRRIATDRYIVCYEDDGRILQGTVICTQTKELQMNVTVFVMKTVGR